MTEFASLVGVSPPRLSKIENDKQEPPRTRTIREMVKHLELSAQEAERLYELADLYRRDVLQSEALTPFGECLRRLRSHYGLSLNEFSSELGLSPSYLSRLEKGKRGSPGTLLVARIAEVLQLSSNAAEELMEAAHESRTVIRISSTSRPAVYRTAARFEKKAALLQEPQLHAIQEILDCSDPQKYEDCLFRLLQLFRDHTKKRGLIMR